jgi:hypothetical protein
MSTLLELDPALGIRVEAAIDYYESLRMAQILHHTRNDPNTLNIDLDVFMSNYTETVTKILVMLGLHTSLPKPQLNSLVSDMEFYDVNNSPFYRLSMSNPIFNHVNPHGNDEIDFMELIHNDSDITSLYSPVLALMNLTYQ